MLERVDKAATFASFLEPFVPKDQVVPVEQGTLAADKAQRDLASLPLKAQVETLANGHYTVSLVLTEKARAEGLADLDIACWPITTKEEASAVPFAAGQSPAATWPSLTFEALTSFYAFRVRFPDEEGIESRFVVNTPLENAPAHRRERILQSLLQNQDQFIRFLLLLLSADEVDDEVPGVLTDLIEADPSSWNIVPGAGALFESLLRALGRDPRQLDQVAAVVEDLRKTPEGTQCLPAAFKDIWEPIWAARQGGAQ
jgi:hypothetical protein